MSCEYSKTCLKRPFKKKTKICLQDRSLNAGQKYCRMLQGEHSAILSTFTNLLPFVIKIFVLSFLSDCLRQVLLYVTWQALSLR